MPSSRSGLTAALAIATATMAVIYSISRQQAALIVTLISGASALFSIIASFLQSKDKLLEQWADDLASQVTRAWSHRMLILLGWSSGLITAFDRRPELEADVRNIRFEKGDWSNIDTLFLE